MNEEKIIVGRVMALFVTKKRGEPMTPLREAQAEAGKGLVGDRYYDGAGTFSAKISPAHEVSLIEMEALEALRTDLKVTLDPVLSRRNILTRGIALNHFVNREFTVGEVVLRGVELCEPCGHMEKLSGMKGARLGLVHRGGLRCQILKSGSIRIGDTIGGALLPEEDRAISADVTGEWNSPVTFSNTAEPDLNEILKPEVATVAAMDFALVPPGDFFLGSENDPLAWDGETPQQRQTVDYPYWISRYPISRAQYAEFVGADGYKQAEFWPEAIATGVWRGGLLDNKVAEEAATAPYDYGARFSRPAQPQSGVTWYEALAFIRWLGKRWREAGYLNAGLDLRLPSELEWEKAARGGIESPTSPILAKISGLPLDQSYRLEKNPLPKRRFPWGDNADPSRANFLETGIGATSALGQFPDGASPYGAEELSGNVWEWTRSLWGTYPYPLSRVEREVREKLTPNELRTLKGGGFNYRDSLIRCSVRHFHSPMMRYRHIGFRAVVTIAAPQA